MGTTGPFLHCPGLFILLWSGRLCLEKYQDACVAFHMLHLQEQILFIILAAGRREDRGHAQALIDTK
ncbi:hypothetical protein K443DRAFT_687227 [Laccaria amethystina LaAM-08-1]|uniref:Uncharacterized protein n=1 Tax=Laccaria amethystina LaAM-08-1 TaxID=1095629 RepID=A0A0C9WWB7_9AGAR|nr:hypothetical protein K443DRAFT_687227 [Laccaria amethystina LaAM-08-1]